MSRQPSAARARILDAAHELFYRDGLRATGIDRIIAAADVTKATFYRHFPSKDDLIAAYLAERHARRIAWLAAALVRHAAAQSLSGRQHQPLAPLHAALAEWFATPEFRGCAFINSVAELGEGAAERAARYKREMTAAIATLLPPGARPNIAEAACLAADGAIIWAQMGDVAAALEGLQLVLIALGRMLV
jgi:AcrR family transcriptional regulator